MVGVKEPLFSQERRYKSLYGYEIFSYAAKKIDLNYEHLIPFSFFVGFGPRSYKNVYLHFFKSLACLAMQTETIVKKIMQLTSQKKNLPKFVMNQALNNNTGRSF